MSRSPETATGCAWCGLPLARPLWSTAATAHEQFCCFGCRFAASVTRSSGESGAAAWTLVRLGLAIFFSMNVMVFTMALWSGDLYEAPDTGQATTALQGLFRYLCLLFALPVLFLLGGPLLDNAWQQLRQGRLNTDLLLLSGVAASYLYSAISVFTDRGHVYFEVGCLVLVLVTLGRWLEATGRIRAGAAIEALARLLPETVRSERAGMEVMIPLEAVRPGDCLRVLPGERLPCDGQVVRGTATVDEQVLTGESATVIKDAGDQVLGGTLNLDGDLLIQATAAGGAGALERLINLVRTARQAKGHYERLADRVSGWFLPLILLLVAGTFVFHASRSGLETGILTALAVVLIACPCALGLATPMAVWTALGQAARAQVLFRSGEVLERLAGIRAICFDKTGTLTTGTPMVQEIHLANATDRKEMLEQAARLAAGSAHDYARAILSYVNTHSLQCAATNAGEVTTFPGRGVSTGGAYLGSVRWLRECGLVLPTVLSGPFTGATNAGQSVSCIGWEGAVQGVFVFREAVRSEARETLEALRSQGLVLLVLTGDHAARGAALEPSLGIPVRAQLLPEDKVAVLEQTRRTFGPTAMVGDGLNDAPALARSDVGIAMGCGADVARDSAAMCLLGDDLRRLPWAIALSRQTIEVIRQNLFWAFFYNVLGIGLACTGYLNPVLAALAMVLSSALVVTNSQRLARMPLPPAVNDHLLESPKGTSLREAEPPGVAVEGRSP